MVVVAPIGTASLPAHARARHVLPTRRTSAAACASHLTLRAVTICASSWIRGDHLSGRLQPQPLALLPAARPAAAAAADASPLADGRNRGGGAGAAGHQLGGCQTARTRGGGG